MMVRHGVNEIAVARVLSLAPASLSLSAQAALDLLQSHGTVHEALKAARSEAAAADATVVRPVAGTYAQFGNLCNAGNSCYLDAVIVACFAQWDAWDALIAHYTQEDNAAVVQLRTLLREVVNSIREGEVVSANSIQKLRDALVERGFHSGNRQEDASELFAFLVDQLGAPLLPFELSLVHSAEHNSDDNTLTTERILWLALPSRPSSNSNGNATLMYMINRYFFGDRRRGLRRARFDRDAVVDAWCRRFLLPEYTPRDGANDRNPAARGTFHTLALPFAIMRYNSRNEKNRMHVNIPVTIDFSQYVTTPSSMDLYTLKLKSVVCHLGSKIRSGHYITYTYESGVCWRKWDDLESGPVECSLEEGQNNLPEDDKWCEHISRDSYMVFYELVPGDGTRHPSELFEASSSGDLEISHFTKQDSFFVQELQKRQDTIVSPFIPDSPTVSYDRAVEASPSAQRRIMRQVQAARDEKYATQLRDEEYATHLQDEEYSGYKHDDKSTSAYRHADVPDTADYEALTNLMRNAQVEQPVTDEAHTRHRSGRRR